MTAITIAARLLRVAADELKNAHTLGGDWGNEHEALDAYNEHMATATTLEHMARQCLAQIEEPANTWPAGLLERVKSALERIENNHCTRRIPADPTDPDLVLAEVRYLLEGKTPPFWVSKLPQGAAPAAVSQRGEYPQLPEGVMFIEQVGGDVIGRPTDYGFKHGRGIVHGAELFTSEQLRAYFDLGRQPSTAAPALEAPPAVAPQGEYPHEQMDAMALARYKVVPSHASMLWSHAVVAGDGAQQLYVGREVECQNMARKFAGAFLDGAFAFHSTAAAPTAPAAPALEAPAAPARIVADALIRLDAIYREEADCDEPPRRPDWLASALHLAEAAPQAPAAPAEAQRLAQFLKDRQTCLGSSPASAGKYNQESWDDYERAWTMLLGMAAPAAPSAIATQVIENLLQLARIVNTAVEDWGESFPDGSCEVKFHKDEADKMEAILEFFDGLPDAPEEEGVILSGPSRAARVLRAQAAPAAPEDPMDWPLPCDVTVGHGTIRKGCKLRTLVLRMQVLYNLAQETELAAPAAPAVDALSQAARDVLAERRRQVEAEGYDTEHDDAHVMGEIGALAALYLMPDGARDWDTTSTTYGATLAQALLPEDWTMPTMGEDRRRDLVKGIACGLAELERWDRASAQTNGGNAT